MDQVFNWKMLKLVKKSRKNQDPSLLDNWNQVAVVFMLCMEPFGQSKSQQLETWKIIKTLPLFKQSPVMQADYLANDMADSHINKKTEYLFIEEY